MTVRPVHTLSGSLRIRWMRVDPGGGGGVGGWVLSEKLCGVCGPLPETLTLFMTKICDIPYPIYDLTFKSKPCSDQRYDKFPSSEQC